MTQEEVGEEPIANPGLITRIKALTWPQIRRSPYFLGSLLGLLVLSLSWILWYPGRSPFPQPTLLPTPLPTVPPPARSPSPWATDSAILLTQSALASLSVQIDQTDMAETDLAPPLLDLNVSFE
ncbi:MAG: hypothetical protein A2784_01070 [Candidatus Chisholmbacteria bacterium RIFCSPHIGHO2_01_FULL_48_12]|uniref:Uncharacterized protein n=1 Tax=Candidatus Chisholmbacteria bacterium RIFCSPHIGHO2_01_FULL_48_12 TaxID=1797589 RepID=A0A1G1VJF0_9BACT|nr:MAG: hypothetical protein A2784_01070 [Candidatus Chisholmbacteria bacterium RIFCSPHIGHO2_01_FULL_48_12]